MSGHDKCERDRMADDSKALRSTWVRSLLERHEGSLVRFAARITGDAERARDVVQEVFLRLCGQDPATLDGHVTAWLYTACRNRAVDVRRKERRMNSLGDQTMVIDERAGVSPPEVAESRESSCAVLRLLSSLSENQQEVIRLRFQGGLSYREISAITDLSVSNVGFLIHTGIKTIREKLGAGEGRHEE